MQKGLIIFYTACLLLACSNEDSSDKKEGVIPQHQLDALEKANNVEAILLESEKKRGELIQ